MGTDTSKSQSQSPFSDGSLATACYPPPGLVAGSGQAQSQEGPKGKEKQKQAAAHAQYNRGHTEQLPLGNVGLLPRLAYSSSGAGVSIILCLVEIIRCPGLR